MSDCGCQFEAKNKIQRKVLKVLFILNAAMFLVGIMTGILANSTALVADSLDMFSDAVIFAISFYAIGKSSAKKINVAFLSGIFQVTLASMVLIDVFQRVIWGSEPESNLMISIAILSLTVNSYCMFLMVKHSNDEVHMRASWMCLRNDVIANFGVILAGLMVSVFHSRFPDLIIGLIISMVIIKGGFVTIQDARNERRNSKNLPL